MEPDYDLWVPVGDSRFEITDYPKPSGSGYVETLNNVSNRNEKLYRFYTTNGIFRHNGSDVFRTILEWNGVVFLICLDQSMICLGSDGSILEGDAAEALFNQAFATIQGKRCQPTTQKSTTSVFNKALVQIDKMAGLRVLSSEQESISIQGWDDHEADVLEGTITDKRESILWHGVLVPRELIATIFQPHDQIGRPKTIATREGRLGRPKTVGVLRLVSSDGRQFTLQQCNGGEEPLEDIASMKFTKRLVLEAYNRRGRIRTILFDEVRDRKKLEKLREGTEE